MASKKHTLIFQVLNSFKKFIMPVDGSIAPMVIGTLLAIGAIGFTGTWYAANEAYSAFEAGIDSDTGIGHCDNIDWNRLKESWWVGEGFNAVAMTALSAVGGFAVAYLMAPGLALISDAIPTISMVVGILVAVALAALTVQHSYNEASYIYQHKRSITVPELASRTGDITSTIAGFVGGGLGIRAGMTAIMAGQWRVFGCLLFFVVVQFTSGLGFAQVETVGNEKDVQAEVRFHSTPEVVPVCNDGSWVSVQRFNLTSDQDFVLTEITLSTEGTTAISDVVEVGVTHLRRAGDREFANAKVDQKEGEPLRLRGRLEFSKGGTHLMALRLRTREGANLDHRIGIQVKSIKCDGKKVEVTPIERSSNWPQRLAYPIHHQGAFDCHTFRIPGIAKAKNGDLLAVYDMRYNSRRDLQEDIDIGLSRSTDGGRTWTDPVPIMDMGEFGGKPEKENGCSDPLILVDDVSGTVLVAACWTFGKPGTHQWTGNGSEPGLDLETSTQFIVVRSEDHGRSWGKPENWTKALKDPTWYLFAPAPGNGITMTDGTLVMPTQGRDAKGFPFSNITWSKDRGKTWTVSQPARDDTTECAVAQLSNGSLMLNMRDNRNRRIKDQPGNGRAISTTKDLGKSWEVHSSDHRLLPEPTCMASLIAAKIDGKHRLYFSNPRNPLGRSMMTLQMSDDDGVTWPESQRILLDSRGGAYSSLVMIDDQTIGILYESSVADFVFQRIAIR